ncbi:MAG: 4-(cytidine 5'-diphospho)-2-C-methyl-D-erythritol kinase [Phocaeicola sp.]
MITLPIAKINLGLNITEKRSDGYHNLETLFYPVHGLQDALEVVPMKESHTTLPYNLQVIGAAIAGNAADNLVVKAYLLLKHDYPTLPAVDIFMIKHIPMGAGLGGGSADASYMLKLLNEQFSLGISVEQLESYAAQLGADCAFFIKSQPVYATGIGNVFQPIELSLKGYHLVIVKPDVFVSTKEAFAGMVPQKPTHSLLELSRLPLTEWKERMVNDFEKSVFQLHPQLAQIKADLYAQGALYAAMSGSGSSLFGIFATPLKEVDQLFAPHHCYQYMLE